MCADRSKSQPPAAQTKHQPTPNKNPFARSDQAKGSFVPTPSPFDPNKTTPLSLVAMSDTPTMPLVVNTDDDPTLVYSLDAEVDDDPTLPLSLEPAPDELTLPIVLPASIASGPNVNTNARLTPSPFAVSEKTTPVTSRDTCYFGRSPLHQESNPAQPEIDRGRVKSLSGSGSREAEAALDRLHLPASTGDGDSQAAHTSAVDRLINDFFAFSRSESAAQTAPMSSQNLETEVGRLLLQAADRLDLDDHSGAMELVEKVLVIDANNATAQELQRRCETTLLSMFESKIGDTQQRPKMRIKPDEIVWLNLDHRAGFVLSRVDGSLSYEELFLLSGMGRLQTARILAQLVQDGIIG